jgi:HSP20 family protein
MLPSLREEIDVKVEDGVLTISAAPKQEKDEKFKGIHRSERFYGRMERQVTLPSTADFEKVETEYKDGILSVTLPKTAGARSKSVYVKVK